MAPWRDALDVEKTPSLRRWRATAERGVQGPDPTKSGRPPPLAGAPLLVPARTHLWSCTGPTPRGLRPLGPSAAGAGALVIKESCIGQVAGALPRRRSYNRRLSHASPSSVRAGTSTQSAKAIQLPIRGRQSARLKLVRQRPCVKGFASAPGEPPLEPTEARQGASLCRREGGRGLDDAIDRWAVRRISSIVVELCNISWRRRRGGEKERQPICQRAQGESRTRARAPKRGRT